jgi:Metallo-beta-lactamase superfamily
MSGHRLHHRAPRRPHPVGDGCVDSGVQEWLPEWQELVDLSPVPPEVCLENRLKELALGPDDFQWVVLGHLHTDHAGGLRIFQDANVDIVLHENEYNHVQALQSDAENFFAKVDFAFLNDKKPTTVSGDTTELARNVRLVSLPGTPPGRWDCSFVSTRRVGCCSPPMRSISTRATVRHRRIADRVGGAMCGGRRWRPSGSWRPNMRHSSSRATTRRASSSSPRAAKCARSSSGPGYEYK